VLADEVDSSGPAELDSVVDSVIDSVVDSAGGAGAGVMAVVMISDGVVGEITDTDDEEDAGASGVAGRVLVDVVSERAAEVVVSSIGMTTNDVGAPFGEEVTELLSTSGELLD
jgi:hypothetical protein